MDRVDKAFQAIDRRNFLPVGYEQHAAIDAPLPIGYGQTNSQPFTVRLMLRWLDPRPGEKILDVGSGSGWTTALLAYQVGSKGKIYGVERVPELVQFGADNCRRVGIKNVEFFEAKKVIGLPLFAPYDRILVSASASKLPAELLEQLKVGGKLVIPIQDQIDVITKTDQNHYETETHPGFVFVPLVSS